jgi:hypothetical protein
MLVDLYWNRSLERQAFSRVWRLEQEKETYFVRFVVENTIETRIFALQNKKLVEIGNLLRESRDISNTVSPEDIAELLGHAEKDEVGRLLVFPDYADSEHPASSIQQMMEVEETIEHPMPDDAPRLDEDEDEDENEGDDYSEVLEGEIPEEN